MTGDILILTTTYQFDKGDFFDINTATKIKNSSIHYQDGELIFARDIIVTDRSNKTDIEVNKEIIQFVSDVSEHLQEQSKAQLFAKVYYFLHSKDIKLDSNYSYKVIEEDVKNLKNEISSLINVKSDAITIIGFNHTPTHYWDDFLINKLEKTNHTWAATIDQAFKDRKTLDEQHSKLFDALNKGGAIDKKINTWLEEQHSYVYKTLEGKKEDERILEIKYGDAKTSDFQVVHASMNSFCGKNNIETFIDTIWPKAKEGQFLPTIIIGKLDIMCDWAASISDDKKKQLEQLKRLGLDPRYRFLDSCIWLRYVSQETNEQGEDLDTQLQRVVGDITTQLQARTYETNVAKEYIEYHYRLFKNSYLKRFESGHAHAVTPFQFHSETYMQHKADELFKDFDAAEIEWNLLLVDDFAEQGLTIGKVDAKESTQNTKKTIIGQLLNDKDKTIFYLESETSVAKAVDGLVGANEANEANEAKPAKHYDAILLDYLFSQEGGAARYGTDLLKELTKAENADIKRAQSFDYKFWIYPVSVFSDAFHSSLREKGMQHNEKEWVLGRGADPINTPQLFRYDFFDFIHVQLKGVLYKTEDIIELLVNTPIKDIDNETIYIRPWARKFYHTLWTRFGKSESLTYGSRFAVTAEAHRKKKSTASSTFKIFQQLAIVLHNLAFASIFDFEKTERTYLLFYQAILSDCPADKCTELKEQLKKLGEGIYAINQ